MHSASADLLARLADHAARHPRKPALITDRAVVSWREFLRYTKNAASLFRRSGLQPGGVVAANTEDPVVFYGSCVAAAECRSAFVPVSNRLHVGDARALYDHCSPAILVHDSGADEFVPGKVVTREEIETAAREQTSGEPHCEVGGRSLEDVFVVLYTSGTTSAPKGVARDVRTCNSWWSILSEHNQMSDETVTAVVTPLYSGMSVGCVLPTLFAGGTCLFSGAFEAQRFLDVCGTERPTFCQMSPTHWSLLMATPHFSPTRMDSCKRLLSGGARLDARTKQELLTLFPGVFAEMYGTSESGAISDYGPNENGRLGSVGLPLRDVEIRILDESGARRIDTEGEIAVRNTRLMQGYFKDPTRTDAAWYVEPKTRRKFYRTGDIGRLDGDGYLWIAGRRSDVLIAAGFNVHTSDIEEVLLAHAAVRQAAVVAIPHKTLGEAPVGFVTIRSEMTDSTAGDVCAWANEKLGNNQRLYAVHIVEAIPTNDVGKPLKQLLSQMLVRKEGSAGPASSPGRRLEGKCP